MTGRSKTERPRRFMFTFLASFAAVLAIPLAAGLASYSRTLRILEDISHELNRNSLSQVADSYDTILQDTEKRVIRLAENVLVRQSKYFPRALSGNDIFSLWRLYTAQTGDLGLPMARYLGLDTINFLLYYEWNDLVLCMESHYSLSADYGTLLRLGDLTLGQFRETYLVPGLEHAFFPETTATVEGRAIRAVPYVESLPVGSPDLHEGCAMYFLSAEPLRRAFREASLPGSALLVTSGGRLITSEGDVKEAVLRETLAAWQSGDAGERGFRVVGGYFSVRQESRTGGLQYIALSPMSLIFQRLHRTRVYLWTLFAVSVLAGLFLVVGFSLAYARPLDRAYRSLAPVRRGDASGATAHFSNLAQSIGHLVTANRFLSEELAYSQSRIRDAFFSRLIDGSFHTEADVREFLRHADLDMSGNLFCALQVSLEVPETAAEAGELASMRRALARETVEKAVGDRGYVHLLDQDRLAVFLRSREGGGVFRRIVEQTVADLSAALEEGLRVASSAAAGSVCDSVPELHRSFAEAREVALHNELHPKVPALWFDALGGRERRFYYPVAVENALLAAARAGDAEETDRLLDRVFEENFGSRTLAPATARLLMTEVLATLYKSLNDLVPGRDGPVDTGDPERDGVPAFFSKAKECFRGICARPDGPSRAHAQGIIERAEAIVQARYGRPDFSLLSLGEELGVSYPYLSRSYRQIRKRTLFDFLEDTRIQQALQLLASGESTINQVSSRVGYASDKSFRRAFKRVTGSPPRSRKRVPG